MIRARRYCAEIGLKKPDREQVLVGKNQILSGCWQLSAAIPRRSHNGLAKYQTTGTRLQGVAYAWRSHTSAMRDATTFATLHLLLQLALCLLLSTMTFAFPQTVHQYSNSDGLTLPPTLKSAHGNIVEDVQRSQAAKEVIHACTTLLVAGDDNRKVI